MKRKNALCAKKVQRASNFVHNVDNSVDNLLPMWITRELSPYRKQRNEDKTNAYYNGEPSIFCDRSL